MMKQDLHGFDQRPLDYKNVVDVLRGEAEPETDEMLKLVNGQSPRFDHLLNVAGPWAEKLLADSGIRARYRLDVVRGSHLVIECSCPHALILEVPGDNRIFFVLPWKGRSRIGTTEVRQSLDEPIPCSEPERDYLLDAYNHFHTRPITPADIAYAFAGVRPLVKSASDPTRARRDYALPAQRQTADRFRRRQFHAGPSTLLANTA